MNHSLSLQDLLSKIDRAALLKAKQYGFSDRQLAHLWKTDEATVRQFRKRLGVLPTY